VRKNLLRRAFSLVEDHYGGGWVRYLLLNCASHRQSSETPQEPAMVQLAEPEAPAIIDASINYYLETGEKPYTYSGGPGSTAPRRHAQRPPLRRSICA
jgi:hypothetical protein